EAAKTAGINFGFTATESLGAVEALAKAGVSTSDILGGALTGALTLAAAGNLDVATAAETASKAMTQFGLSGKDIPKLADLLAAGAATATGDVTDFAQALNQAGLVASQAGIPIEETVGALTAFAAAGLLGSDAGTSFRTMLLRLQNPSKESAKEMERLGINAFNAQGEFIRAGEIGRTTSDATCRTDAGTAKRGSCSDLRIGCGTCCQRALHPRGRRDRQVQRPSEPEWVRITGSR
ncbi:MAG: phage tail tape measure protein, partial [Flavobacteriales bacterium]|nr:phage tail tape measure protein [Flavobacteriales bacterium]